MAASMDLPIIETALQGWRDAAAAREKMPTLFWIAIAIMIALAILHVLLGGLSFFSFIVSVIFGLAQALALTPLAIAVHRFVLLDEARDAYDFAPGDPRFQKFFLFTIGLDSWRVFLVLLCTVLPVVVIQVVLGALVVALFFGNWLLSSLVLALIIPVITVFTVAAMAASASRLFAAYADRLGRPSNLYPRPAV